jgi:hypothetical protein
MSLHVLVTPMRETHRETRGIRWCFECRRRVEFYFVVTDVIEQPSYYDPSCSIECERGHYDGDLFPGRFREWE